MRLSCGRLEQCRVRGDCLSMNCGSIKIRPVLLFLYPQFPAIDFNMSATAKSTTPTVPSVVEPKDWTKAPTPELQSGSEDKSDVLNTKVKEHCRRKQVKREEKQHREEAERRACEEVERAKVEVEQKAREEVERQARKQAEKDRAEVQWRAAEVAARQRAMAQEASKKRMREEPEAGPVGELR